MRIVIDLQCAQSSARNRGMGRYALALSVALARLAKDRHEVILVLNGAFAETIKPLREVFAGIVGDRCIKVWNGLVPSGASAPDNRWRRLASEEIYAHYMKSLEPDFILVLSLFEGFGDDFIVNIDSS